MKLNDYQKWVRKLWSSKAEKLELRDHFIMCLGLAGETGEVLEILKKHIRDGNILDKQHLIEELGDVFYYLNMICNAHDILIEDVIDGNVNKLEKRYKDRL